MKKYLIYLGFLSLLFLFTGQGCVSISGKKSTTSGPAGMFISFDKGDSWKQINVLPKTDGIKSIAGVSVYRIFDDPQDPRTIYLATRSNGMFFSYDEGVTWQQPDGPLSGGFIYSVAVHPKNKCVIYVTNGLQVFRSDDCSRSWVEMYRESRSDIKIISLAFNSFYPHQIILAESHGDILKSEDEGKSWMIAQRFNDRLSEIKVDNLQENVMYVASLKNGLYKTIDGGNTWINLRDKFNGFSGALEYRRLLLSPILPNTVYWVSTYGILESKDGGQTWTAMPLITPPGSASIYGFGVAGDNDNEVYYTATIQDRSTFYKSIDGGKNWITKKVPSGQIPTILRIKPGKSNTLFLGFTIPTS